MKYFLTKFKGTLITALVFIILLLFIYHSGAEKKSEVVTQDTYAFVGPDEEISSVEIYYPKAWALLENEGEKWFLLRDEEKLNADNKIVDRLVKDIKNTDIAGIVPTNEVDLDQFGLENAKAELVVITDEKEHRFVVGDKIPVGSGTYVYVPDEDIVLVVERDYLKEYLSMSPIDFRERGLLEFDSKQVNRISIWSASFSADIYKEDGEWFFDEQDDRLRADDKKVNEILWVFSRAKVLDFESENPGSLKKYGLDEPTSEIRFYEDGQIHGVIFGKRKDKDSYYITSDSDDPVYSIHKSLFKRVPKNIDQIILK